ncbi:MAG: hypothetical protein GY795_09245, partial [Desulfobacterales bacterium]|nr:hypothetical protein [Desulfobacterales bacterium]
MKLRTIQIQRLNLRAPAPQKEENRAQQALEYSNEEKNMELIQCLGTEGQRLFSGTPDYINMSRDHSEVLKTCEKIFYKENNHLVALHRFRKRTQLKDESATEYSAELRILSVDCEFGEIKVQNEE